MPEYYFDIETKATGEKPDYVNDEIISICYQPLDNHTGRPKGPLTILKGWETSEEDMLARFLPLFNPDHPWQFVPIGNNLSFDYTCLLYRYRHYGTDIKAWKLFTERPSVDIKALLVLFNGGSFKGSGLDNFTRKATSGAQVIEWVNAGDYAAVEEYIRNEAAAFIELYQYLLRTMPETWRAFAREIGLEGQE
jgi:hypothetical protein